MAILDQIQTVVIVMMENRSFDHVLGHLSMARFGNRKDVARLVDPETNLDYTNFLDGEGYQPFELEDGPLLHDLPHSRNLVATQLGTPGAALLQKIRSVAHYCIFRADPQCQISNGVITVGR